MLRANGTGIKDMNLRDRVFAFEHAYYHYRNDLAYRQDMIRCGTDALLDGVESENVVLLAGALDGDGDIEVVGFFLKAALEVGCDLPRVGDDESVWIARHSVKCLAAGLDLPDFDISKQVDRNLIVCLVKLGKLTGSDEKLGRFTDLLGKYVEHRIDDYEEWLGQLFDAATKLPEKKIDPVVTLAVERIASVIDGFSFGAIEMAHHEESLSIAADLLNYNAGKSN